MGKPRNGPARAPVEAVPDPDPAHGTTDGDAVAGHAAATCPVAWCPVCLAVTAVQPVRPEVVEHLLKAGTEFFMALRSLIDARADDVSRATDDGSGHGAAKGGLEKIEIG
jgi:hypothetical protein